MEYKLYANCIKCKGVSRSIICDLQRNKYHLIPNSLFDLFDDNDQLSINFDSFEKAEIEILSQYVEFLLLHELIFAIENEEKEFFPKLSLEWDFPSIISNIIIDVEYVAFNWEQVLAQIEDIKCYYLQIRFFRPASIRELSEISSLIFGSTVQSFEIFTQYIQEEVEVVLSWAKSNPKLRSLILFGAPLDKEFYTATNGFTGVYLLKNLISSSNHCGNISPSNFSVNIETFTESLKFNSCLNRKISIDGDGEIKNCPSMEKSYGNIKNTKLLDVANDPTFQQVWSINKDQISICKDCEFRYICTDCRAYLENPADPFSKPLKCGYDPKTCQWEKWSTNPLKEAAIEYYSPQTH